MNIYEFYDVMKYVWDDPDLSKWKKKVSDPNYKLARIDELVFEYTKIIKEVKFHV